jgi:hypothetical protein
MNAISLALLLAAIMGPIESIGAPAINRAFNRLYNFDFAGVHSILDEHVLAHPDDPLAYSTRAIAFLFSELNRMKVLETDFFMDDDQVTDRKKLKPDPVVQAKLFQMTREARKKAGAILALKPADRNAMFAMCMASGVETDYTILIEKKYIRSFSMSKESQVYARKLLAMNPPASDAHLTLGMVEYVVSNLNWFFRLFVHFNQIEVASRMRSRISRKLLKEGSTTRLLPK